MKARTSAPALEFKKLLVGFELGETCAGALVRALELARLFDGSLEIVHAAPPSGAGALSARLRSDPQPDPRTLEKLQRRKLEVAAAASALLQATQGKSGNGVDDRVVVASGKPATVLVEHAARTHADLILLGGLRDRGLVDFGSTARGVLAKAPCAIWVQHGPATPIRRILVACDFSTESRRALATAVELAQRTKAVVHVVHVFDPGPTLEGDDYPTFQNLKTPQELTREEFEKEIADVDWRGVEHSSEMLVGPPAKKLLEKEDAADLFMLGTHGRTGFAAAVLGSVAYSVLVRSKKPVCVVRDPARSFAVV